MTHEELLQEINERLGKCDCSSCNYEYAGFKALRAVVELHRPDEQFLCVECSLEVDGIMQWAVTYPCQTIQVIEKELK